MTNSNVMPDEERSGGGFLNYLPAILWQRRWVVIPPIVLLTGAGIAAAALLPTTYQSSATVLVESPELPSELVGSPVSNLLDQRIAKIRQQVLSRGDLIALIEQNGLYDEERRSEPLSAVVEQMREAVTVEAVESDIGQSSSTGSNTIAFKLSFDYRDAVKAQAVMQALVERFLAIDTTERTESATGTVSFLQDQANSLQQQIAQLEGQTTAIKTRYGTALAPPSMSLSNTGSYDAQIAALQSENRQLLSQTRQRTPVARDPAVAAAEAQLAAIRARYSDEHPDVAIARQRLAEIRALSRGNQQPASDNSVVQAQIAANNATIQSLTQARSAENARTVASMANSSRAPAILEQVAQLDARTNALRERYDEVAGRLLAAQNSSRMATEQRGERLTVIEPPVVPDAPVSYNPWLLVLAGLGLGLGVGVLLALILEMIMRPIRGVDQIADLGLEPLAVVPTFKPDAGGKPRRKAKAGGAGRPVPAQAQA